MRHTPQASTRTRTSPTGLGRGELPASSGSPIASSIIAFTGSISPRRSALALRQAGADDPGRGLVQGQGGDGREARQYDATCSLAIQPGPLARAVIAPN